MRNDTFNGGEFPETRVGLIDAIAEQRRDLLQVAEQIGRRNYAESLFGRLIVKAAFARIRSAGRKKTAALTGGDAAAVGATGPAHPGPERLVPLRLLSPGTSSRSGFDTDFRPLSPSQKRAWVRAFLNFDRDNHETVMVRASGGTLVVEHGHYAISVARALGIEALRVEFVKSHGGPLAGLDGVSGTEPAETGFVAAKTAVRDGAAENCETPAGSCV